MAFIGILIVDFILIGLFIAAVCAVIGLIGFAFTSLIIGVVLTITGRKIGTKSKRRIFGIVFIVLAVVILVPAGALAFKLIGTFI